MKKVMLKSGKEKPLLRKHPWVFSGALERMPSVDPGELVVFYGHGGKPLAQGYLNPKTQLCGRILSFDPGEKLDERFWRSRLEQAIRRRQSLLLSSRGQTTGCRLIMSESDQLPGLIVDLYGSWLVVQVLTAGIERMIDRLIDPLWDLTNELLRDIHDAAVAQGVSPLPPPQLEGILEKSDDSMRSLEGLSERIVLRKSLKKEDPDESSSKEVKTAAFLENSVMFTVDLYGGQKTGYYHDQRENHAEIARRSQGLRVLDCCSYTGGFTLAALKGGASHVTSIDQSGAALDRLEHHLGLNKKNFPQSHGDSPPPFGWERQQGDAFKILRQLAENNEIYDIVILDPPKFAAKESHVQKAARGYKDLNLWGLKLVRPGGLLATFSCSGHISPDLFQKIIFGAALDAQREVQIIRWFQQGEDHPVLMSFPEGYYLKGLLLRVL